MLESFIAWYADNFVFHILILLVLFIFDTIDFYVQTHELRFIRKGSFGLYFFTRAFLSITIMELSISLGLLNAQNKAAISFITPLIFSTMLQNLVVAIGGEQSKQLDLSDLFKNFRQRVITELYNNNIAMKRKIWKKAVDSKMTNEEIEKTCQVYAPSIEEFEGLSKLISNYPEDRKRVEYAKQLVEWVGEDFVEDLLEKPKNL